MTGKDIDAVIKRVSFTVSEGINIAIGEAFMNLHERNPHVSESAGIY